jgi:uncharacterized protein (DUF305 family)
MKKISSAAPLAAFLLIGSLAVTGCTINIGTAENGNSSMGGGMMHDGDADGNTNDAGFTQQEQMFAMMMIPHHQQAVDMSKLAKTHTTTASVLKLAAQIEAAQAPEIKQMTAWLGAGQSAADMMHHDMGMGGMMSEEDMSALAAAKGKAFDKLYLAGMIEHHQGALDMVKMISDSNNDEVLALHDAIVKAQTAEIDYMKQLLAKY